MATRLELLARCINIAVEEAMEEHELDGWAIITRSGERCMTVELYRGESEYVCTFPTAGWDGTINTIKNRFAQEAGPPKKKTPRKGRRK